MPDSTNGLTHETMIGNDNGFVQSHMLTPIQARRLRTHNLLIDQGWTPPDIADLITLERELSTIYSMEKE